MLGKLPINIQRQPKDLHVEETGTSYLENALLKAEAVSAITKTWTIADDSGLEVDLLGGAPGIFSARFAKSNKEKLKKLLDEMGESPYRSARFCSVMVICDPEGKLIKDAKGICWGEILKQPAYPHGEFESLFWVREAKCTYGELSNEQLSKLGSRGKAARELAPHLKKELNLKI